MLVGRKLDLSLAVGGPRARAANLEAAAAERHLAVLVTVAYSGPLRVPLALRADDLVDLLFHHFAEHAEPDAHAEREQALLRCPNQLPQRLLHALGKHGLIVGRLRDRYGLIHGGSSSDLGLIAHHAPTRSGRAGGTAVTSSSTSPGTTPASSTRQTMTRFARG